MGLFNKLKGPVFLKESSDAETLLNILKEREPLLNEEGQSLIKQDIQSIDYGIVGEKKIEFELRNSHIPMYILHDIYLECGDLTAQIDYLVFTRKLCFVIECKNLYGNIEINKEGEFIRTLEYGRNKKKEGIYSPITQNQRHLDLMKTVRAENKSNLLLRFLCQRQFDNFYKSVIVLANPKTVLHDKYAKKEIRDKVIRADQLIKYIKDMCDQSKIVENSDKELLSWAQFYLDLHKNIEKNYTEKYEKYRERGTTLDEDKYIKSEQDKVAITVLVESSINRSVESNIEKTIEDTEVYKDLREYRLNKSRVEMVKPYFIYNNNQLIDLITKMPQSKEELRQVNGFGGVKVDKYGDEIIEILRKYIE